jgi:hypothetical protein
VAPERSSNGTNRRLAAFRIRKAADSPIMIRCRLTNGVRAGEGSQCPGDTGSHGEAALGFGSAVWLQVRVLPAPPRSPPEPRLSRAMRERPRFGGIFQSSAGLRTARVAEQGAFRTESLDLGNFCFLCGLRCGPRQLRRGTV